MTGYTTFQQQKTLFQKLGGAEAINMVVNKFYDFMMADERVYRYFENTNMELQRKSQKEFLAMVTGGPMEYEGKDMKAAHCPYPIGIYQFDSTWQNLEKALKFYSVPLQLILQVNAIFYSVKDDVVNIVKTQHKCQRSQQKFTSIALNLEQNTLKASDKPNLHSPSTHNPSHHSPNHHSPSHHSPKKQSTPLTLKPVVNQPWQSPVKALKYSQKPSQNMKRKLKLQIMEKEQAEKKKKKIVNCPYNKPYY